MCKSEQCKALKFEFGLLHQMASTHRLKRHFSFTPDCEASVVIVNVLQTFARLCVGDRYAACLLNFVCRSYGVCFLLNFGCPTLAPEAAKHNLVSMRCACCTHCSASVGFWRRDDVCTAASLGMCRRDSTLTRDVISPILLWNQPNRIKPAKVPWRSSGFSCGFGFPSPCPPPSCLASLPLLFPCSEINGRAGLQYVCCRRSLPAS